MTIGFQLINLNAIVGRGALARRKYEALRREAAAIKIQKVYRGW